MYMAWVGRGGDELIFMAVRKSQLEKTIQSAIQEFLELQEELGLLVYQKNNTGAVRIERPGAKSSFMRFGKKGSPDFLVWRFRELRIAALDHDTINFQAFLETLFIEVKTDVGKQSDAQRVFQQKVEKLGGIYLVVRSLDDVKKIIL